MDVDALHALTLNANNAESSVTVNQRALIDKVLSRYSSENTLLRELLQNSDDANATAVKIIYESSKASAKGTLNAAEDLNKRLTKRVIVKNNGQVFRPEDWTRLSRIAEGNPDEAKIGAFGVGFYSVFSICEDPFVTSGNTGLAFYWRNDQLFTRSAKLPTEDSWTSFSLNMRQEVELPNLRSLTKFLATSLTFSRSLSHIELWLDNTNLCTIKRVASPGNSVSIPAGLQTTTSGGMLRIHGVDSSSVQITATYLNSTQQSPTNNATSSKFFSFFSSSKAETQPVDPLATTTSTIFLRVLTGGLTSSLKSSFSAELQRATKKPPPKQTKIQLVTVSAAEYAASTMKAPIFENLMTFPHQGRIYIGFPTHQTTGFSGHVGAPCVIPTVERESIDLVDRYIKLWNFEVLRAIGLLTRIAYHIEYSNIQTVDDAIHTMKFFSMSAATPQSINQTIEPVFFESHNMLPIISSSGVQSTSRARLPDARIQFLKNVPIIPARLLREVPDFMERLKTLSYIEPISIGDIKRDLQDRVLSLSDGLMFLKYCVDLVKDLDPAALSSLMKAGVLDVGEGSAPINIGYITSFTDPKLIPQNVPLPSTCLPHAVSVSLTAQQMRTLGWQEIGVVEWLNHVVNSSPIGRPPQKDINTNPEFATLVLSVISKNFDAMRSDERANVVQMLKERSCIPTKNHGMQKPDQAYFHTIKMFDDLPLILTMKGVKERFLAALGVRKTIELTIIFDRLVTGGKWSAYDVISYLASVRKDIPARDIERLKTTPLAVAEGQSERKLIKDLYEPIDTLRSLQLPVIGWPKDKWKVQTEEANLLFALGLQRFPPASALVKIAGTSDNSDLREKALKYFILNYILYNYGATYKPQSVSYPFVPTETGKLERPTNIFTNPACAIFGFEILRKDLVAYATILGVQTNPPPELLLGILLQRPPRTHKLAVAQYQLIALMSLNISKQDREQISQQEIIPIERDGKLLKMVRPSKCFFKQTNVESLYHEIFDFVDFGIHGNSFLRSVGVRDEPSTSQIAGMLVTDTQHIWSICGSEEKYKQLLIQVARDLGSIKKDRHLFESMRRTKFLIAYKYIPLSRLEKSTPDAEDIPESVVQTTLQKASDMVVVDDVIDFELFRGEVHTCPQDIYLEELYRELGASRLSSVILDRPITHGRLASNDITMKLKINLLERLSVFLSDPTLQPKRDVQYISEHLQVSMQEKISMQRDLRFGAVNASKHVKLTALVIHEGNNPRLVITPNPDNYDIAVAICKLVLQTSKTGNYLLLETLLSKSLRTLKSRGYNVDRILQREEREKRDRQIRIDAEARQAELDRIEAEKAQQDRAFTAQTKETSMESAPQLPGSFPKSISNRPNSGFMANIKKNLGLQRPDVLPDIPGSQGLSKAGEDAGPAQQITANPRAEQGVTSQASINQALQQAIKMTRSSDDKSLFSTGRTDQIAEAKSFCDSKPAHDLVLAATLPNDMKLFCNRLLDPSLVVQEHAQAAQRFSNLLAEIGKVFNVNHGSISISYDAHGPTIAFNKTGTIYCNLRFFSSLHQHLPPDRVHEAVTYWYVTIAHELAHNLVSEHSSEHEFYMESMIINYLPRLLPILSSSASSFV